MSVRCEQPGVQLLVYDLTPLCQARRRLLANRLEADRPRRRRLGPAPLMLTEAVVGVEQTATGRFE